MRLNGWLNALIANTTPIGSFWVKATLLLEASLIFIGITLPASDFKTSTAASTPSAPLLISIIESWRGLPPSLVANLAKSLTFCLIFFEKLFRTSILSFFWKFASFSRAVLCAELIIFSISFWLWHSIFLIISKFHGDLTSNIINYLFVYLTDNLIL